MSFTGIKKFILAGLILAIPFGTTNAQRKVNRPANLVHNKQHIDLLANQKNIRKEISLIDSVTFSKRIKDEKELYPALSLYGDVWDQEWVNPYKNTVQIPDSFNVDVSDYCMPITSYMTSQYGPRGRRMHRGVDLKLNTGDTVRAAFSGRIRLTKYEARGYGYYVVIRHGNGLETIYGHLSRFLVRPDQVVKVGDPIALGGNTGRSTGSHLHFETRFLGLDINPTEIFDFVNQVPHTDNFVFYSDKYRGGRYYSGQSGNSRSSIYEQQASRKNHQSNGKKFASHRVKQGDTLSSISSKYGVSVNKLCQVNRIGKRSTLRLGQVVRLP